MNIIQKYIKTFIQGYDYLVIILRDSKLGPTIQI